MKTIIKLILTLSITLLLIGCGAQSNKQDYSIPIVDITISTNDTIPENEIFIPSPNIKEVSVNEVEELSDNKSDTPIANVKPEIVYVPTAQEQMLMDVAKEYVIGWRQGYRYEDASEILQDHDIEVNEINKVLLENYIAMEVNGE